MASPTTEIDPVCGMRVDPSDAPTREHRGVTYHFCSVWCAERFDNDADAYIAAARIREAGGDDESSTWEMGPPRD
jgi:YHS domain-containing protein